MRIAIVSDVHANLAALQAVLRHAEGQRALDAVWSLGDFVGYGPQPNQVIALLRELPLVAVSGNHDLAATGAMDTSDFNEDAAAANRWNASQLTVGNAAFLRELPATVERDDERMVLCHGSLRWPAWEYVITEEAARAQFQRMQVPWSFVGHTHIPLVIEEAEDGEILADAPRDGEAIALGDRRLILNPGGVGQPRDGDPRAAYAVLDTGAGRVEFYRVPYPIRETQTLMEAAGLPVRLIRRLEHGR
jgi:diadenosine tetraphosphatase ApaH/serine/threonine PP2A family protein phosphatase